MKTPVWYYKLLQTDLDGTTHEIGTVAIKNQVELSDKLYSTFPNPFKESIRISNNGDNGAKKLEIMDITGNTVMSIDFVEDKKNSEFVVNTTELKEGVYLIKISGDSGNAFLQKMVKIN
jgi:hypothetical protein